MLRTLSAVALAAAMIASSARADDFGRSFNGPPGAFAGPEAGVDINGAVGGAGDVSVSGASVGVHAGYNLQNGPIVGGVEGDSTIGSVSGPGRGGTLSQNETASIRARGGYAFGSVLAYGTVGPAWAASEFSRQGYSASKSLNGVTYGVGAEFALTRNLSARAELRHYDFNAATYYTPTGATRLSSGSNQLSLGFGAHF